MLDIKIDTNYSNYDAMKYYSYESLLHSPCKEVLNNLLSELDATKLCNGVQISPTNSWRYEETVERYIRTLFRIPIHNFVEYNYYVELLLKRHNENLEFESNFVKLQPTTKTKTSAAKKKKVPNVYVRTETHNLFTGEVEYDYTNFATGDSFISPDPNLLEQLNALKKKKKEKKEPRKDFGKIVLNFKLK